MAEEEIIKEEVEEEEVEEKVSEETGEEETLPPGEPEKKPEPTIMEETVENLKREISGLKKGISSERGKRQRVEGKLEQLGQVFAEAKQPKPAPTKIERIPVEFDDNGNPFVSPDVVAKLTTSETKQLQERLNRMESYLVQRAQQDSTQQNLMKAVDPGDLEIHAKLKNAYTRVDQLMGEYISLTGHQKLTNIDEAFDLIEKAGIDKQFEKEFPGIDLESTIEAFTFQSPRKLKRAISLAKRTSDSKPPATGALAKMKQLEVSSHIGRSGTPGGDELTLDQIANLNFDELSDAQMAKIERILRDAEK
jgi:hypothetical protein